MWKDPRANVFAKYAEENKSALTGIGVIATITALFLNLDQSVFGSTLTNLQLLLLLFLTLGLASLTVDSFFWLNKNVDSWFAGLVSFSIGLATWRIWEFVLANFRKELNQYLFMISVSAAFAVHAFFNKAREKIEPSADKKISRALSRAFLTALFFYLPSVLLGYYFNFAQGEVLSLVKLLDPFSNIFLLVLTVWMAVTEFCFSFFFTKERASLWLNVPLLAALGITLLMILWSAFE